VTIGAILLGTFPFYVQTGFEDSQIILGPLPITAVQGNPSAFSFNVSSGSRVVLRLVSPQHAGTLVNNILLYNGSGFQHGKAVGCLIGCYAMRNYAAKPNDTLTFLFNKTGGYYFAFNYGVTSSIEPPSTFVIFGQTPQYLSILGVTSNSVLAAILGITGVLIAVSEPRRRGKPAAET